MNEAETRAEYIDPKLKASGWGEIEGSKILREFRITDGRIQAGGMRGKPEIADYILVYKNHKIGVVEAKTENLEATEGVAQAKTYAQKLQIDHTYSTNGKKIYQILMKTGKEEYIDKFPTPDELWNKTYSDQNEKTIIFCATQDHALAIRDLINQMKESKDPNYCVRVTANDGARGEQFLREFQDNEKIRSTFFDFQKNLYAKLNPSPVLDK